MTIKNGFRREMLHNRHYIKDSFQLEAVLQKPIITIKITCKRKLIKPETMEFY